METSNENLRDFYESLNSHHIILLYKGGFNQELIRSVLALTEYRHGLNKEKSVVKGRVVTVIVECMQNVCHHAATYFLGEADTSKIKMKPGIFLISKNDNEYIIATGNLVLTENESKLKTYLDKVKALDMPELKKFHSQILKNTDLYGKYGADLGLISIAKVASKKFEYEFRKFDDQYTFFSFSASVSTLGNTLS